MKICSSCKLEKSLDDFHNSKSSKDGKVSKCKSCAAAYNKQWQESNPEKAKESWRVAEKKSRNLSRRRATKYGLTIEQYNLLLTRAGGKCELCSKENAVLNIDHSHITGEVRGLLCLQCNTALGNLNDDINLLEKAIEYLQAPKALR